MEDNPLKRDVGPNPWQRLAAVAAIGVFVIGLIFPTIGAWNSIVLTAWLVGTQKPWRGFLFVFALALIPNLVSNWNKLPITGAAYMGWMVVATLVSVLPYFLHRIISPRLQGLSSTLPLPLWGVAFQSFGQLFIPESIYNLYSLAQTQKANMPLLHIAPVFGIAMIAFLMYWFASTVNWAWDFDFKREKITPGAWVMVTVMAGTFLFGLFRQLVGHPLLPEVPAGVLPAWSSLIAALFLSGWAFTLPDKQHKTWSNRPDIVARLQSPYTGELLQVACERGKEVLVSPSGERFPIRNGIPDFLKPGEITGPNRKYNQLYEVIGGFYDSTQKFVGALQYGGRDHIFLSYLRFLEVEPGDTALETSVGTGLNFTYLPKGVRLFGLDLSAEMLANCQANLRRWELDADLFHGNAECLPFGDNCFDVVFHAGGINFFNDRAKAIREMIRVAKPGSRILIADETEEHVKGTYEQMPVTGSYFKDRKDTVAAPIDLVPPEMLEIHMETIWEGKFYALTFRKPE